MVIVRESSGAIDGSFSGTYGTVGITFDRGFEAVISSVGDAIADGEGRVELPGGTVNVDGNLATTVFPGVAAYSVDSDGTRTTTSSAGETSRGAVSRSGRYAFVAGGVTEDSLPTLRLFVRR
jgi:hypothetical protein